MKTAILVPIFFLLFAIPVRAEVTREQIKEVGKELACLCGDCPRRPSTNASVDMHSNSTNASKKCWPPVKRRRPLSMLM